MLVRRKSMMQNLAVAMVVALGAAAAQAQTTPTAQAPAPAQMQPSDAANFAANVRQQIANAQQQITNARQAQAINAANFAASARPQIANAQQPQSFSVNITSNARPQIMNAQPAQAFNAADFASNVRQQITNIQQKIARDTSVFELTHQINELQDQSVNLNMQVKELQAATKSEVATRPSAPAEPPELAAAMQTVADAKSAQDALRQKLVSAAHNSEEYRNAELKLEDADSRLADAKAENPVSRDKVASLATEVLSAENAITRLEQKALDQSPDWLDASAKFLAANKAASAVRATIAGPAPRLAVVDSSPTGKLRQITALRDKTDAQIQNLMGQLRAVSPYDAEMVAQEGVAVREVREQQRAGAQQIRFTPDVSPQVQQFIQGNVNQLQQLQDPTAQ